MYVTNSELYAIRDGIKYYYDEKYGAWGHVGHLVYEVPCEKCGTIMKKIQYSGDKNYLCEYCKRKLAEKRKLLLEPEILDKETKYEQRFNKAVEEIENQVKDFDRYAKDVETARKRAESYGSIPEAMVAIELLHLGFKIIPQQKIDKYRVDFALPTPRIVIEIDGRIFHQDNKNQKQRDQYIQQRLGYTWKIIHIPAENIRENITKLGEIMNKMR